MPFPYAYYQDNYNGPIHATKFTAPGFFVTGSVPTFTAGGTVNIADKSHIAFDTSSGSIVINNLTGGKDGQLLFIYKISIANSLTIRNQNGAAEQIRIANRQDLVLGTNQFGGIILICREEGATKSWYQIDTNGFFADGSSVTPSIAFSSDINTGLHKNGTSSIGFSTAGVNRLTINSTTIASSLPFLFSDGSTALPSIGFLNDPDTGFYREADRIVMTADAINRLAFTKTGSINCGAPINFTDFDNTTFMRLRAGSLMISDLSVDDVSVPVNGIYSKGNVKTGGIFEGEATSARYADLAERYESDAEYPTGTIVRFGGSKEITLANNNEAFGIVSTNPGFVLNANAGNDKTHPPIALAGRVPCRVIGKIKKNDIIWSFNNGVGSADKGYVKIGRALEDKNTEEEGLVLIVTKCVI
jgi:hypothetical protein